MKLANNSARKWRVNCPINAQIVSVVWYCLLRNGMCLHALLAVYKLSGVVKNTWEMPMEARGAAILKYLYKHCLHYNTLLTKSKMTISFRRNLSYFKTAVWSKITLSFQIFNWFLHIYTGNHVGAKACHFRGDFSQYHIWNELGDVLRYHLL